MRHAVYRGTQGIAVRSRWQIECGVYWGFHVRNARALSIILTQKWHYRTQHKDNLLDSNYLNENDFDVFKNIFRLLVDYVV